MDILKITVSIAVALLLLRILMIFFTVMQEIFTEPFETNLSDSENFHRYIINISPDVFKIKLGMGNTKSLLRKQAYLSRLKPVPQHSTAKLELYSRAMKSYFTDSGLINLNDVRTNFVMSINNLEMSMPYTIDNMIVLNESFIKNLPDYVKKNYVETIIHEKIHTIQRKHQAKFNEFYKLQYPFLFKTIPLEKLPVKLIANHMTNPDNNFDHWLYKINDIVYIPILEINEGKLLEVAYEYTNLTNKVLLSSILTYSKTSQSHPNELFAYTVASQIVNGRLESVFRNFLLTL